VRDAAAEALLAGHDRVVGDVVARITPRLLETRIESVASRLLLLVALQAESGEVVKVAAALSTNDKRRVMLLLAICVLRERESSSADRIARMLPANHPGVAWALAGAQGKLRDTALDDLGDPIAVAQVLLLMRRKQKNR